jgi:Zn-dependent peptidase ImmA (M78 family)
MRPTIPQLRKAAKLYGRTLAVLFLPEPPADFDTMRDFRRVAGSTTGAWSPELHAEYRRAHVQREYALELAEIDEVPIPVVWALGTHGTDEDLAAEAREVLFAGRAMPVGVSDRYAHMNLWSSAIEDAGVLVMHTERGLVDVDEMRAFSLYFDLMPVIAINGADAVRGRLFSLVHEYAHLLLHDGGLCDTTSDLGATNPVRRLEARCNAIAAAMLMPESDVLASPEVVARFRNQDLWDYESLRDAAAPFGVSAEAFLRRLATLSVVSDSFYSRRREEFAAAYRADSIRTGRGGGDWYRTKARDLGKGYVRTVASAWRRRVIDSTTAATFLDAKVSQIPRLAETASSGGS